MNKIMTAIVFPGQGSQAVGMLADVSAQFKEVKETFNEASTVLGYDLWQLVQDGPASTLDQTVHTQPALLAASYALWRILKVKDEVNPAWLAGHSLGEYTALVCAEAIAFEDAISLVAARGLYMQEAIPPDTGAMGAIIGLDETAVIALCKEVVGESDTVLSPANFNSVGQTVIAGHKEPVMRALTLAKAQGAKLAVLIPVSVPSHCKLMAGAQARLAQNLANVTIHTPIIPIINNVEVKPYTDAQSIREGLLRQLCSPVRWVETIQFFVSAGVNQIIECGPGKVLTGLNKRIDKQLDLKSTSDVICLV